MAIRFVLAAIIGHFSLAVQAQGELKIFGEPAGSRITLFASNAAPCPSSVKVELELTNMELVEPMPEFFVVPPDTARFRLTELRVMNPTQRFSYRSRFLHVLGDAGKIASDETVVYDLPFASGGRYMVFQGYNGAASHQNQFALDFAMPEGTLVLAAREGVVVRVQDANDQSCPQAECAKFNNFVLVYHSDGSFAEYTHLKKDGASVAVGDKIRRGDPVGLSGNTGWTTGPHLHFVCFLSRLGSRSSFATRFRTGDGSTVEQLSEKSWYSRKYPR